MYQAKDWHTLGKGAKANALFRVFTFYSVATATTGENKAFQLSVQLFEYVRNNHTRTKFSTYYYPAQNTFVGFQIYGVEHSVQRGSNPHIKTPTPTCDSNPNIKIYQLNPNTWANPHIKSNIGATSL